MKFDSLRQVGTTGILVALGLVILPPLSWAQAPARGGAGGPGGPGAGARGGGFGGGGRGGGMQPFDAGDHTGYVQIFDGKTMDGWDYPPEIFRVEDGEMIAGYNPAIPTGTTFAVYTRAEPADFDLLVDIKSEGGNTGVHFRSIRNDSNATNPDWMNQPQLNRLVGIDVDLADLNAAVTAARTALSAATFALPANPDEIRAKADALATAELNAALARETKWAELQASSDRLSAAQVTLVRNQFNQSGTFVSSNPGTGAFTHWYVGGYQADYPAVGNIWEGGLRGRTPPERGNLTTGGNVTIARADRTVQVLATLPTGDDNGPFFHAGDWNTYHIMARGRTMILFINGHMISMTIDDNSDSFRPKGVIGLQIEGGGKQHFKNIWLKQID